jgi:hypothetical protein
VFPDNVAARVEGVRAPTRGAVVAYLDVITAVNGIQLSNSEPAGGDDDDGEQQQGQQRGRGAFAAEVRANVGRPVLLVVFNWKAKRSRTVQVRGHVGVAWRC